MKNVGVYSVQGDVAENIAALKAASSNGLVKCSINEVITAEQIMNLDALVIPVCRSNHRLRAPDVLHHQLRISQSLRICHHSQVTSNMQHQLVAIPPAAKFTTGRRPSFAVSFTRSYDTCICLDMRTSSCVSPEGIRIINRSPSTFLICFIPPVITAVQEELDKIIRMAP